MDHHISYRFLPLFVAVWTVFQVKWVGASVGWDPLILSTPNWPLGQPAALVWCSICVDDLFQFYTVVVHTTGYIFMSTRKSISSIVWTDQKVEETIRTTNNLIVICWEWTDFSPYNCYMTSAIQYFLDVFQMKLNITRYFIAITH